MQVLNDLRVNGDLMALGERLWVNNELVICGKMLNSNHYTPKVKIYADEEGLGSYRGVHIEPVISSNIIIGQNLNDSYFTTSNIYMKSYEFKLKTSYNGSIEAIMAGSGEDGLYDAHSKLKIEYDAINSNSYNFKINSDIININTNSTKSQIVVGNFQDVSEDESCISIKTRIYAEYVKDTSKRNKYKTLLDGEGLSILERNEIQGGYYVSHHTVYKKEGIYFPAMGYLIRRDFTNNYIYIGKSMWHTQFLNTGATVPENNALFRVEVVNITGAVINANTLNSYKLFLRTNKDEYEPAGIIGWDIDYGDGGYNANSVVPVSINNYWETDSTSSNYGKQYVNAELRNISSSNAKFNFKAKVLWIKKLSAMF